MFDEEARSTGQTTTVKKNIQPSPFARRYRDITGFLA
jgi:hypothetical protein